MSGISVSLDKAKEQKYCHPGEILTTTSQKTVKAWEVSMVKCYSNKLILISICFVKFLQSNRKFKQLLCKSFGLFCC